MPLEQKRYLLTTHLEQIAAMVDLPAGVIDLHAYGWHAVPPELVRGYWLEPHMWPVEGGQLALRWELWSCQPRPRFDRPVSDDLRYESGPPARTPERQARMLTTAAAAALLALTTAVEASSRPEEERAYDCRVSC